MSNPLAITVDIPFRGGSYRCRLDMEGLFAAEMDLNISIISPSDKPFNERPAMVQMLCYLYALLSSCDGLNPSIRECRAALAGPKASYITERISEVIPSLTVQLTDYAAQFAKGGDETSDPLGGAGGGLANGPTP